MTLNASYFFSAFERNKENVLGNLLATSWMETDLSKAHFLLQKI